MFRVRARARPYRPLVSRTNSLFLVRIVHSKGGMNDGGVSTNLIDIAERSESLIRNI